jgi:hypothetical protein
MNAYNSNPLHGHQMLMGFYVSVNKFKKNGNKYIQKQNLFIILIKCIQIVIKKQN